MARVGVFGGSFNPPHLGHLLAAREFQRLMALDEVFLVPDYAPPHKELPSDCPSPRQRYEMTALLGFPVLDLELVREGVSYTADTLLALRKRRPEDTFFLYMGTDMFLSFHTWSRPEVICREAVLCPALRKKPNEDTERAIALQTELLTLQYGAKICRIKNETLDISSTVARRMAFLDCAENYIPAPVLQYIRAHNLYGIHENHKSLSFDALCRQSLRLHKEKRRAHVIGCSETARKLAVLWGADPVLAERAGILHDITKAMDKAAHLALCERYGMGLRSFEKSHDKLLHSKSGAAVARGVFGECDEVVSAIYWHTTGKADMTLLEKIIYLADYMEPNRDFEGVEILRELAWTDLDMAMYRAFQMSVDTLLERGKTVDSNSQEAMEYMKQRIAERSESK